MKKLVKKIRILILVLCSAMLFPSVVTYAADGTLQFSDPTGKVGEEITVKVKMDAGGVAIGDGNAVITYDKEKLEFVSGTNATGGDGTVTISASGTGSETELNFELVFRALTEGSTTIQVSGSTAYLYSDETLNLQPGTATVTIEAGDGSNENEGSIPQGEANIEIFGTMYAIYENFTDALIPEGFSKAKVQYNGSEHNAVIQDISGKTFFFLITGSDDPVMALYEEDNSLTLAESVNVTEDFYILILAKGDGTDLPDNFVETTLELNGIIFPAWQNMDSQEYYLVYALNSNGEEEFYQYDTKDGTYQRYVVPEVVEEEPDTSSVGKIESLIEQNLLVVAAVIAAIILLLLIIVIVQTVKLGRRNAELDELYDEYDEEDDKPAVREKSRKQFVGFDDEFIEDDLDEEYGALSDDEEYDDEEYDDEEYDDEEYDYEKYDDEEYDDDEYDDDDINFIDI